MDSPRDNSHPEEGSHEAAPGTAALASEPAPSRTPTPPPATAPPATAPPSEPAPPTASAPTSAAAAPAAAAPASAPAAVPASAPPPPPPAPASAPASVSPPALAPAPAPAPILTAAPPPRSINVRILSPALEATAGIELTALPVDTTVGQLRQRLCDAVPSHPPPDRQRLIFQGRLLANDSETLHSIFGSAALNQHNDFTLHLVVRQPQHAPIPDSRSQSRSSTPQQSLPHHPALHPSPPLPPLHGHAPPPAASHVPVPPPHRQMPPVPGFRMVQMPGMPPIAQYVPNHLQPNNLQPALNHAPTPTQTPPVAPPAPSSAPPAAQQPFLPPDVARMMHHPPTNLFQDLLNRHQHERAALGQHGIPRPTTAPPHQIPRQADSTAAAPHTGPDGTVPLNSSNPHATAPAPNTTTTTSTIAGPNGTRYTVTTVNRSTFSLHPMAHQPPRPQNAPPPLPPLPHHQQHFHQPNSGHHPLFPAQIAPQPPRQADVVAAFDDVITAQDVQDLAELTAQYATTMQGRGNATEPERRAAQELRAFSEAVAARIRNRNAAANSTSALPLGQDHLPTTTTQPPNASLLFQPAPQSTSHQAQPFDAAAATVYLLSSPTGPYAILLAPDGTYTTRAPAAHQTNYALHPFGVNHLYPTTPTPTQSVAAALPAQHGLPGHDQRAHVENIRQLADHVDQGPLQIFDGQQQQQQQQQPDQQVDLLQQWQPLLAQAWLLLRVMLFTWILLGTGQGWRRPLILLVIGLAFWALNGGIVGRGAREAVQGWWEGVIGVPRQDPLRDQAQARPAGAAEAQQQQQENLAARQAPGVVAAGQPAPQNQAEQQRQQGWLRQTLRPAERAFALFIASLWPGVGERTVAARRDEENRLRRLADENRAREETLRLQNEEAATAAAASASPSDDPPTDTGLAIPLGEPSSSTAVASGADVAASKVGEEVRERKPAATSTNAMNEAASAAQNSGTLGAGVKDE
ncbi:hypothetical protein MBLNU459_g6707t1 [Dothideomycetes sp. NU459]